MPIVSIILPTYNRETFLPEAFGAIASQTFTDWELIVVDDGSTDNTRELVPRLIAEFPQPVYYIHQKNGGPAAARNTGIDQATGRYLAFYDSDDQWLPHHLEECIASMDENPKVDWVFAATRGVERVSGKIRWENSFQPYGKSKALLNLYTNEVNGLRIINDPRSLELSLRHGFDAGLQTSVIRARVFETLRLPAQRVGEDQVFVARAITAGFCLAYFNDVHVVYSCHNENISMVSEKPTAERIDVMTDFLSGFEELQNELKLSRRERWALSDRLCRTYFWQLGYPLADCGQYRRALGFMWKGLRLRPWQTRLWKSFVKTCLQAIASRNQPVGNCVPRTTNSN